MKVVRQEVDINAPPDKVFGVIADLERYAEWCTFTPRMSARQIVVGEEFDLDCRMTETQLLKNEHEVFLAYEPDKFRVCWGTSRTKGRPGIKSFRWQICEPLGDSRTHFINYEEFHGILAPLVHFMYGKKLARAFEGYCRDLRKRAESPEVISTAHNVAA